MSSQYFKIITNDNFFQIHKFEAPTSGRYTGNIYGYELVDNNIIFNTTFICCPCLYYIKQGDKFCFSFCVQHVENWCKENNIKLISRLYKNNKVTDFGEVGLKFKESIRKNYKYLNIQSIEGWKQIILHSDGTFEKIEYKLPLFELNLIDNFSIFKKWLFKYRKATVNAVKDNLFIPTITGGLDTRTFTYFYKDLNISPKFWYVDKVKQDGKNEIEKGQKEFEIATTVLSALHFKDFKHTDSLIIDTISYVSLSGMFNENARILRNVNDENWVFKNIQHAYSEERTYDNLIMPYIDDMFLMLRQDNLTIRCLMALLFCENLLDIPLIGFTKDYHLHPEGYLFYNDIVYKDNIDTVEFILKKWFANITKNELLSQFKSIV